MSGLPATSASGLPGNRVEAKRAGMMPMIFTGLDLATVCGNEASSEDEALRKSLNFLCHLEINRSINGQTCVWEIHNPEIIETICAFE